MGRHCDPGPHEEEPGREIEEDCGTPYEAKRRMRCKFKLLALLYYMDASRTLVFDAKRVEAPKLAHCNRTYFSSDDGR